MKAIETIYNGYRFRSRLEARWAVFFDALGVEYRYEDEGYNLNGVTYLPDFWLPKHRCWIEIKPDRNLTAHEAEKVIRLAAFAGPVIVYMGTPETPVVDENYMLVSGSFGISFGHLEHCSEEMLSSRPAIFNWSETETKHSLRLLNDRPGRITPLVVRSEAVLDKESGVTFIRDELGILHGCVVDPRFYTWQQRQDGSLLIWPIFATELTRGETGITLFRADGREIGNIVPPLTTKSCDSPALRNAYDMARRARFEFGENGVSR